VCWPGSDDVRAERGDLDDAGFPVWQYETPYTAAGEFLCGSENGAFKVHVVFPACFSKGLSDGGTVVKKPARDITGKDLYKASNFVEITESDNGFG